MYLFLISFNWIKKLINKFSKHIQINILFLKIKYLIIYLFFCFFNDFSNFIFSYH
jgi:hypothetical protein